LGSESEATVALCHFDIMEDAKLIIHNLPGDYTTDRLRELFGSYGEIMEGEFKWGIGFVGYSPPEAAETAFTSLNGTAVDEKKMKIDFPGRKIQVSRLIVKNLPTTQFTTEDLRALFAVYGTINECVYMWGYGFIKFKEEKSVEDSIKALKGTELTEGRKIFFEIQGPNGEINNTVKRVEEDLSSVHSRIGPVRIFLGALNEGTTEEEVLKVVEPLGEIKKIDVKANFGFIHFKEPNACRDAHSVLSKQVINGANPRVQLAEIKRGGKLFVGGIEDDVNQEELITTFLEYGPVVEYKFVKKFAFFTFDDPADAKRALELNGKSVGGYQLKVAVSSSDRAITNGDPHACHSCGVHGHVARYCPADKKDTCHNCGQPGHWSVDCPLPNSGGSSKARVRSRSPPREDYHSYGYGMPDYYGRGARR